MVYNFDKIFLLGPAQMMTGVLRRAKFTPNQITLARFFLFIPFSVFLFAQNRHLLNIIAVILLYFSVVLDQVDGNMAREYNLKTEIGAWLDDFIDRINQVLIIMGIIFGVFVTSGKNLTWLVIGFLLILGTNLQTFIGGAFKEKYSLYIDSLPRFWSLFENKKISFWHEILKDYLAPRDFLSTIISTYSYYILFGAIFNVMNYMILIMAILANVRWMIMTYVFARCVMDKKTKSPLFLNIRKLKGLQET